MSIIIQKHSMAQRRCGNNGYIALISVIILGAISLAVATSLLLLGLGSSRTSFAIEQSNGAKALANMCAETSLLRIKNENFLGTGNISITEGNCSYIVSDIGGNQREIRITSSTVSIVRKIKIIVSTSPMGIVSWQEVGDF